MEKFATQDEHNILKQRVDNLEKMMKDLRQLLKNLEDRFSNMKPSSGAGFGSDELENLQNQLDNLRKEFNQFRDQATRNLQDLNITMPTKADKSDLVDLENRFRDKLDEIIRQLIELIPNKEEINKRFAAIQKKLREIMDQMKNKHDHDDDAMFSKKHLGPVNCASCEKDIVNLIGMPVDYYAWKRMPQRGAPDRIARYGQGFSKLL
jgi:flagellar biosynthesis chaperone FliJ